MGNFTLIDKLLAPSSNTSCAFRLVAHRPNCSRPLSQILYCKALARRGVRSTFDYVGKRQQAGDITCAAGVPARTSRHGNPARRPQQPWQVVSAVCAVSMLLCNFHRSVFTALAPLLADRLALAPSELALLQSAMLWGYLAGQIPAGRLADTHGGDRVLLAGLAIWSVATGATAAAAAAPSTTTALTILAAARAALGAGSSVIMPAVSAATAQWVPSDRKAATLAAIYAFFNVGGVLGLIIAPHLAARSGWPAAFVTAAAGGLMWAVLGTASIARLGSRPSRPTQAPALSSSSGQSQTQSQSEQPQASAQRSSQPSPQPAASATSSLPPPPSPTTSTTAASTAVAESVESGEGSRSESGGGEHGGVGCGSSGGSGDCDGSVVGTSGGSGSGTSGSATASTDKRRTLVQVAALCWCHGVIGWGFFVLQAWVPTYLQALGVADLASAGLLASLPWLAAAFTATSAAGLADRLVRSGRMPRLAVRRVMHAVSTLGCAAAVLPLAVAPGGALPPAVATLCLVAAVGCYGASFGGFHAYVQDVAAADAGQLLGLTNSVSILGGIAGNMATGALLQATGSYGGVFWAAAVLYVSSWAVFSGVLHEEPLSLGGVLRPPGQRGGWRGATV